MNTSSKNSKTGLLKNRYGSKKGFVLFVFYQLCYLLGMYRSYRSIDFSRVNRLVFVCHGNICRSPLGEVVAKKSGVNAHSFGLRTRGGAQADPRAIHWAEKNGYDLSEHKTSRVDQYEPQRGDLLIAMEPTQAKVLKNIFKDYDVKVTLSGLWTKEKMAYIHDPYSCNEAYFDACEKIVEFSSKNLSVHAKNM
jgi:protein-tyrosine phosphatase